MNYDVFISYSSKDQKVAEGVCAYLEQHGIRCFIAYRDIPKGTVWARAIVEALDESRMMVIVFSENFNRSEQVDREIELASEDHKPILTFRIANEAFRGAKKYYLKNLNWIDAFPEPEKCFGELCRNVQALLKISEKTDKQEAQSENETGVKAEPHQQFGLSAEQYYENGMDAHYKKDFTTALPYFLEAAKLGHAEAQYMLGNYYKYDYGTPEDKTQAYQWYRKAAEQGHAKAQNEMGNCYSHGYGVPKDYAQACLWWQKAAEQGIVDAKYELAQCYHHGEGVPIDPFKAIQLYREAAKKGDYRAKLYMRILGET